MRKTEIITPRLLCKCTSTEVAKFYYCDLRVEIDYLAFVILSYT